ncbi:MAG: YkgJ family cysteine cluster protein [Treponemataceae bacterium]
MDKCFYKDGLDFSCTQCSCCCRHEPGFVYISQKDLDLLLASLNVTANEFVKKYCRWVFSYKAHDSANVSEALCLQEMSSYDCIFWKNGCTVYDARPIQCRTYPFWDFLLATEKAWIAEKKSCPGIGAKSSKSFDEIESLRKAYVENQPIRKNTWKEFK